ncbi:MAG: hypothetical protein R6U29_03880 [Desulfosudaceae bacterium]
MKLMHITVHFEFSEDIEEILNSNEIQNYVRYNMMQGQDRDGRHFGNQVFPGSITVIQAQVPENKIEPVFQDLTNFRESKPAHQHLEALILPVENRLA